MVVMINRSEATGRWMPGVGGGGEGAKEEGSRSMGDVKGRMVYESKKRGRSLGGLAIMAGACRSVGGLRRRMRRRRSVDGRADWRSWW